MPPFLLALLTLLVAPSVWAQDVQSVPVRADADTEQRTDAVRGVQTGAPVPAFEVRALADSAVIYSDVSLRGQTVLLDFWATWCRPCRAELPELHDAYDAFSDDGFTILSFSFDSRPQKVQAFRENEWAMPWLHTLVEGGFRSDLADRFVVRGIPKPVLVGPDGTVLAVGRALRGVGLQESLNDMFGTAEADNAP